LKYRNWRVKDPGRDDIDPAGISGMLIMNQHYREEPARRPALYATSSDVDWAQEAADSDIALVSTWALFQAIAAVQAGAVSKDHARARLRRPGLVVWPSGGQD
jgi:hypothetical protein